MSFQYIPASTANYTKNRARYGKISEITVHHVAGNSTVEQLGRLWQNPKRQGSSHYGVQGDNIGQYVKEEDIAWTNSNWAANVRAVTIETANSGGAPGWPVADDTLQTLIGLVADIAKRNKLGTLVVGKNLTYHSMYASTACPGPYLKGKMQHIADQANAINAATAPAPSAPAKMYNLTIGPMSLGDKNILEAKAKELGLPVGVA